MYVKNRRTSAKRDDGIARPKRVQTSHSILNVAFIELIYLITLKKIFRQFFRKMCGQLKIQMGHKFFKRYGRKYFRYRTENSSYCLVRGISSLLGKKDIFHNLCGKSSKKSEQISAFHGKNFLQLRRFVKCSHLFDIFPNSSEISPKIWSIFLKFMKYFHFL